MMGVHEFTGRRKASQAGAAVDDGGQPPYDGGMEVKVAKLETAIDYIQRDVKELREDVRILRSDIHAIRTTDFRLVFGAIIAVALGLAGLMAKGFHWL
jgi:hypothetical protein